MALSFSDNIDFKGRKPDFVRQEYATLADLKGVRDNRMPEMYLGYCVENHTYYCYSQTNDVDDVTGRWRAFVGASTVVSEMPPASPDYNGLLVQYIGETTADYIKGYFYGITTGTGDITTVDAFKALIAGQSTTVTLNIGGTEKVVKTFENSGTDYFVYNNVIYSGVPSEGVIEFDPDTATSYTTDEVVAALNITGTTYAWENVPVSPGGSADDKLTWGTALPASGMENGDPFLYMGPDTNAYEEVSGLTPESNPQALGLYESDGSGGYVLSTDTTAEINLFAWYNGSEQLFTLTETPVVGDPVWKSNSSGTGYESAGTVTEMDSENGIKASGASFDSFYSRFGDVTGKTYYALKTFTAGTIYQYDESTDAWIPKTAAGEVESIPVADVEAMFD